MVGAQPADCDYGQVDTIAKRLMSNETKVSSVSQFNKVIFKDKAAASAGRKFVSLFPGLGYAAGYKVSLVLGVKGGWGNGC